MAKGSNNGVAERPSIVDVLEKATPDDLAVIRSRITELEAKLASMKQAERVLDTRLNGPKKKTWTKKAKPAETPAANRAEADERRRKVGELLLRTGRPMSLTALADACGIPHGSITSVITHPWFERTADKLVLLSQAGKQAIG